MSVTELNEALIPRSRPRAHARHLRWGKGLLTLLFFASLMSPTRMEAGSLEVLGTAANRGSNGLRVTVGSSCASPQDQAVDNQTLNGPVTIEACQSVSSSSTTISTGEVVFRAGDRVVLSDGFAVQTGASFVAEIDGVLLPDAYLADNLSGGRPHYAAGFFVNLNSLVLGGTDRFDLFTGRSSNGEKWFSIVLKKHAVSGENRVVMEARQDTGSTVTTESTSEVAVPSGWSWLSIDWKAASATANDGFLRLYLNGLLYAELPGLSNSNGQIQTVRLGADGVDSATSGSFDLDYFVSRIAGPISAPP